MGISILGCCCCSSPLLSLLLVQSGMYPIGSIGSDPNPINRYHTVTSASPHSIIDLTINQNQTNLLHTSAISSGLVGSAPHLNNSHLLDTAEERRSSGCESPTEVTNDGLRKMSISHDNWASQFNQQHQLIPHQQLQSNGVEDWKVAPIAVAYHLSPAVSAMTPITPSNPYGTSSHIHSYPSSIAHASNGIPTTSNLTFSHPNNSSSVGHSHSSSISSISSSPKAEYAVIPSTSMISHSRHGSGSTFASASSSLQASSPLSGHQQQTQSHAHMHAYQHPLTQSHSQSHLPSHLDSHSHHPLILAPRSPESKITPRELLELQQQANLQRSISAPSEPLPETPTPNGGTYIQTPMVSHASHQESYHPHPHAPHQLPVQLVSHPMPTTTMTLPPLTSFRPPISRSGSLDREVIDSARSCSESCAISACSSSTPSSRSSPSRSTVYGFINSSASSSGAVSQASSRDRSRLGFSDREIGGGNSGATGAKSALGLEHDAHNGGVTILSPPDSTGSSTRTIQSHDTLSTSSSGIGLNLATSSSTGAIVAPGSVGSCGSQGSASSLTTLSNQVEAAAVVTAHGGAIGENRRQTSSACSVSSSSSSNILVGSHSPTTEEMVTPSTSTGSTSTLSAKERNAKYKRSRATLEGADECLGANTQLKTSASSAASSAHGAQQAAAAAAAAASEAKMVAAAAAASVNNPTHVAASNSKLSETGSLHRSISAPPAQTAVVAAPTATTIPPAMSSLAPSTPKRQALISVLSCVLTQLFSNPEDRLPTDLRLLNRFHTERLPSISIGKYLERIAHYSECSDEALVMAFIHISRISHNKPDFNLNSLSIHRLLLTSIMVTVKFFDDAYYNNAFYGRVGGISLKEINHLEVDLLELIHFELFIDTKVYVRFYSELRNPILHPNCSCMYQQMVDLNLDEIDHPPQI